MDRTEWSDIKLRDGDEVVIRFAPAPMDREYSAMGVTAYANTTDFWGLLSFEDHAETVAEGEALTLKVTRIWRLGGKLRRPLCAVQRRPPAGSEAG